ncbi:head GIN domain-containing protein [Demequina activiva]|uniref:Putative auto-transporter adhesin head GIN domain-containing protein n=1 Tax=Demequina activiva TaxID=1582364 RepID=A0A919Q3K7_9MICO|nr:head GIN domain-containing protein [Demequina activiva]GIG55429.1 hypothetical protein Dac01nite_21810 [Demequina activiva]
MMFTTRPTAVAVAASVTALMLAGCSALPTDLDGATETRTVAVDEFSRIELNGAADVAVTVGPEASVTVTADTALLDRTRARVSEGTLRLDGAPWTFDGPDSSIRYLITVPVLDAVELSGAGTIEVSGIDAATFAIELTGAGDVTAAGRADTLDLSLDGAGDIDTTGLEVATARVDLSGAGDVDLVASQRLDVDLSGLGDVRHAGGAQVNADVSGAGGVHAREPNAD